MVGRKRQPTPAELVEAERRFGDWRSGQKPKARIPGPLWDLAVKLAGKHGIHRTASVLKLSYPSLKKKLKLSAESAAREQDATFVEMLAPQASATGECVIDFEDGSGAKMRVHLRGVETPDLAALSRSFWIAD